VRRVDEGDRVISEDQHPAALAWEALVRANEALDAAKAAESGSLYRQALLVTFRRARQYEKAVGLLLEELGE
jgi:hypothetical protein